MKHITIFTTSLSSGGAERQIAYLANFLVEVGYEVCIMTFSDQPDHYRLSSQVRRSRVVLPQNPFLAFAKLFVELIRVKTDCLISFTQRANFFSLIPFVFKPRVNYIAGERNFTVGKPTIYEKILFSILYKRADYIVPNSYSQCGYIQMKNKSYIDKLRVITNYTDLSVYKFREFQDNTVLSIGVFCRFEAQKNCLKFVEAMSLLRKRTNVPFVIEWYGNRKFKSVAQRNYFEELTKKIEQLEMSDVIILHDAVCDVQEYICKYDVIALPSLYEGFSNSIAEAICCGRPVLVSDVSDNYIMVHEGVNGFRFDPNDEYSIVNAFLKFFELSTDEKRQQGMNSRSIAEKLFDKEKFINSYIELIEN